jgi:alpha-2-macroglobulin
MQRSNSYRRQMILIIAVGMFLFSVLPRTGYGASEKMDRTRFFTIEKIESAVTRQTPQSPAQSTLTVTFSETCPIADMRKALKIFPPVKWEWSSNLTGNSFSIRGDFRAGQDYTVLIPETFECGGRRYVRTVDSIRWPDLEPAIRFAETETVVERNSKQMIHVNVTNVDELRFEGLQIPPVLIPSAMRKTDSAMPFDEMERTLREEYRSIESLRGLPREVEDFMGEFVKDRQLFFPGKERNKPQSFSLPLSFRGGKEKGAIEIVHLKSNRSDDKAACAPRLFRITDLGITYKFSEDSLLLWVTSLNTGKPVGGVSLLAFLSGSRVIPLGKTDANGVFLIRDNEIRPRLLLERDPRIDSAPIHLRGIELIAASSSSDRSFIELKQSEVIRADWIQQAGLSTDSPGEAKGRAFMRRGMGGRAGTSAELAGDSKGHVFTERGIYRPGEVVHFKGTIREYRDGRVLPPSRGSATFTVLNSKEEEVYKKEFSLSEYGTASGVFETKSYFPLGTYKINMLFAGRLASNSFEVQEFRPPRHFVEVLFKRESKKDDAYVNLEREMELLTCNISGKYYAGGPVKHGKVRWKVYYASTDFKEKQYPEYAFGNALERGDDLIESGESILNEKGQLAVSFPVRKEVVSGIYGVEVVATVLDFDGRASTETALFQEKPGYLVGISSHDLAIRAGDPQALRVIVIDQEGRLVEEGAVNVEVMQNEYLYVRKRDESGRVYWEGKEAFRRQLTSTLSLEKTGAIFDFDFVRGGRYLLKFSYRSRDGREYSSSTLYEVEGYFWGYEGSDRERKFERLSVTTDKKQYAPGDTIRVFFNPRKRPASLLMTVERKSVIEHRTIELLPGKKFVEIPVDKTFEPNVYISFLGTIPREEFPLHTGQFDDGAPGFLFGVVNVEIKREPEKIKVAVNESESQMKASPGSRFTLQLSSRDDSGRGLETEMAVCVVDESVLALTGFRTPTLSTLLKFFLPLSVLTGDLRSELLRQTPFRYMRNEPLTGGGGLGGGKDFSTTKFRKDFRPVAYCNMALRTDGNGRAEVNFTLPDTMTTYRVYVVVCDRGGRFASYERPLLVVKDFYIEPGHPAFFTGGDQFKFFVSAFNKTARAGLVEFNLSGGDLVNLSAGGTHPLAGFDRTLIPVEGQALRVGMSKLAFAGGFDGKEDAVEVKVPIKSGYLLWNDVVYGSFTGAARIGYAFPEGTSEIKWDDISPDDVKAVLTVSSSPFLRLSKGLRYLLHYPYGCIEQTSSGVLPLSALRGLIREGLILDIGIQETDQFLKPGIERLLSMQTDSGGFGYWPGEIHPNPWGTIYAASALTHAKLAGLEIPEERMAKVMQYLKEAMTGTEKADSAFKGYASYILALNRSLPESLFREVYRDLANLSREGALLVLLAAGKANIVDDRELVRQTRAILERPREERRGDIFFARYREPAIALIAASAIVKDDLISGRLAKQLLDGVNKQGIWTSTSDTGWSLTALGEYFRGKSFSRGPVRLTLKQEGAPETSGVLEPNGFYTHLLDPEAFLKKPGLAIETDANADLIYMLSLTFPRVDYATKGHLRGFRIHKVIENEDGSKETKVGDVVKVKIEIDMDDNYTYLVLDDPLPAGLVAINSAIKTEERVGSKRGKANIGEDGAWGDWDPGGRFFKFVPSFFEIRDDRVLAFKDRSWRGKYQFSYYARAVCEGEFIMPSTKIQLMYEPDVASFTPMEKFVIKGRE